MIDPAVTLEMGKEHGRSNGGSEADNEKRIPQGEAEAYSPQQVVVHYAAARVPVFYHLQICTDVWLDASL